MHSLYIGCGVNTENIASIVQGSQCLEIHGSARSRVSSQMNFRQSSVYMSKAAGGAVNEGEAEYSVLVTDRRKVSEFIRRANRDD